MASYTVRRMVTLEWTDMGEDEEDARDNEQVAFDQLLDLLQDFRDAGEVVPSIDSGTIIAVEEE